jgi:hypothetical protein
MTEVKSYECDSCGSIHSGESDEIKQCGICNQDYCEYCAEDHAKDETGLIWSN